MKNLIKRWEAEEERGVVRFVVEPEEESYFDVYGEPDTQGERAEIVRLIELNGIYRVSSQRRCDKCGSWEVVDSIGMIIANNPLDPDENPYIPDLMASALNQKG